MKTNHQHKGAVRFYGPLILALLLATAFMAFSAVNLRPMPRSGDIQLNPIVQKVQQIYTSQLGIREKHDNSGPQVEEYLRYVKLSKGNPWCAAFVCWVYGRAGVGNPRSGWSPDLFGEGRVIWRKGEGVSSIKYQVSRFPPSVPSAYASSQATGNWQLATEKEQGTKSKEQRLPQNAKKETYNGGHLIRPAWQLATGNWQPSNRKSKPSTINSTLPIPMTGDVFGLFFPEKARIAHVGFIDQWDGTWMISVEGNTNVNGSREGDGVYRKRRMVRSVYKVARYVE